MSRLFLAAGLLATALCAQTREPGLYATIHISMGNITVKLFEKETPRTVKNFVDLSLGRKPWKHPVTGELMKKPLYPGTLFHRVIPEFMIQGGDPLGSGSGRIEPIGEEYHPTLKFDRPGRLAMANSGPGTSSCQFFITETLQERLNGRYTIFGQVTAGQEVVRRIARVPRSPGDKPLAPVKILRITFERLGPRPAATQAPKQP